MKETNHTPRHDEYERALKTLTAAGITYAEVTRCPVSDCVICAATPLPSAA